MVRFKPRQILGVAIACATIAAAAVGVEARTIAPRLEKSDEQLRAPAPHSTLNRFQRSRLEDMLAGATPAPITTLRVIAFQVEFSDTLMRPNQDNAFFANELRHTAEYFKTASGGRLDVQITLDPVVYRLPEKTTYYGIDLTEDERVVELASQVIGMADNTVDFSQFDFVFLIHAGAGQETDLASDSQGTQLWSSFYDRSDIAAAFPDTTVTGLPTNDLVEVDNFAVVPADASQDFAVVGTLGIWVYQFCNRLGMLPLFDSTPDIPDSQGAGNFCVMAYGLFNVSGFIPAFPCVFNRVLAGWVDPITADVRANPGGYRLTDMNSAVPGDTVCLRVPITENEYYLVVNRVHDSNFDSLFTFTDVNDDLVPEPQDTLLGAEFDFFLTDATNPSIRVPDPRFPKDGLLLRHTGSGVYIWHVDEAVIRETIASGHLVNDFPERKGVDLEEADGVQDLDQGGAAAFALGSHWDSYRDGDGNQTRFAPDTEPSSDSNAGVETGIVIDNISVPGHVMTLRLGSNETAYSEKRVRWSDDVTLQAPTPFQWDGVGNQEVVVLGGDGVYVFTDALAEFSDGDGNPSTIEPLIATPPTRWAGPPAFGDIDGGGDDEIVAVATDGTVYAWKTTGVEVIDGDNNPATDGVLFVGGPAACPPMLLDLFGDGTPEIVLAEVDGDSIRAHVIGGDGNAVNITDPVFDANWPLTVPGQAAAPMAIAQTGTPEPKVSVVIATLDTLTSRVHVTSRQIGYVGGGNYGPAPASVPWHRSFPVAGGTSATAMPSAPAAGDLDGDGHDEVALTLPDSRLLVFDDDASETGSVDVKVEALRAAAPSGVALGDVDRDGQLEIALFDNEWMYLMGATGEPETAWPRNIVPLTAGELPPSPLRRALATPAIADVDQDGNLDVVFSLRDGTVHVFTAAGDETAGFPRVGIAGTEATPAIAPLTPGGGLTFVSLGAVGRITGTDPVDDEIFAAGEAILGSQSLAGSGSAGTPLWGFYRSDLERSGRVSAPTAVAAPAGLIAAGSFMLYPNPVFENELHARIVVNQRASIRVDIYNLEGQSTFSQSYTTNPGGLGGAPFDEVINVAHMVSGVYFLRLYVEGASGSDMLVKPFAIRR